MTIILGAGEVRELNAQLVPVAPPEPADLGYFYIAILWEQLGATLWHHTWLRLSEDIVGVVPAGTADHPVRVKQISTFAGSKVPVGSCPIQIDIYQAGSLINRWSTTTTFQYYMGPQEWRASSDWFMWNQAGVSPGEYQMVATLVFQGQEVTRNYDYIIQ